MLRLVVGDTTAVGPPPFRSGGCSHVLGLEATPSHRGEICTQGKVWSPPPLVLLITLLVLVGELLGVCSSLASESLKSPTLLWDWR